jgi:drug/metabolite transporter (DMT)-like permease
MVPEYFGELCSVATAILWAGAVVLFKKTGETVHPLSLNMFKNTLATLFFLPTVALFGDPYLPDVALWNYGVLAASGILGIAVADTLFFMSLNRLGANLTAIVDCMYTPFVMVIVFFMFGEAVGLLTVAGAALIISAIMISSIRSEDFRLRRSDLALGIFYGALSMFFMALGVVMLKKPLFGRPPVFGEVSIVWATAFRLLAGTVPLVLYVLLLKNPRRYFECFRPSAVWSVMVPGSILGTYLSMLVWLVGWKYTELSSVAAVLNQLTLIFVAIFAAMFLKEKVTLRKAAAILMAMSGAALAVMG